MGKVKVPSSEYDSVCNLYLQLKSIYRVGKVYHISGARVLQILNEKHVNSIDKRKTTDTDEDAIVNLYNTGMSLETIAPLYNLHPTTIHKILKRKNVKRRTAYYASRIYHSDECFFDNILATEEQAYILGFIYADGCVLPEKQTLSIALATKDSDFLSGIKNIIAPDTDIKASLRNKKGHDPKGAVRLSVYSKHLTERLQDLGIVKSRGQFPKLLPALDSCVYSHFIRGLFDGDGSIDWRIKKNKNLPTLRIRFLGQEDILFWIRDVLKEKAQANGYPSVFPRTGIYGLDYGGTQQSIQVAQWIYQDAHLFMERKRDKYKEFISVFNRLNC